MKRTILVAATATLGWVLYTASAHSEATCKHMHHGDHKGHTHGKGCGHEEVAHDGHTDYKHDGHMHFAHDGHYDDHQASK